MRWRECETECQSGRGTERKRDREKQSEGQRETERDRETERAREGERGRQGDGEPERETEEERASTCFITAALEALKLSHPRSPFGREGRLSASLAFSRLAAAALAAAVAVASPQKIPAASQGCGCGWLEMTRGHHRYGYPRVDPPATVIRSTGSWHFPAKEEEFRGRFILATRGQVESASWWGSTGAHATLVVSCTGDLERPYNYPNNAPAAGSRLSLPIKWVEGWERCLDNCAGPVAAALRAGEGRGDRRRGEET